MILKTALPDLRVKVTLKQMGPYAFEETLPASNLTLIQRLQEAQALGQSYGALIEYSVTGVRAGLGSPIYHKFSADLAQGCFSIGALNGLEFGAGFESASYQGTDFHQVEHKQKHYGGLSGGITNGDPLVLRVSFKPTSSILEVARQGRHDPCIGIRAAVVVESMIYCVLADQVLLSRLDNI
jgi:chorismate synthase